MSMFCYQCQETAKGTGCVVRGVCGKTDDVAQAQDLLVWVAKGISILGTLAREKHYSSAKVDRFVQEALFTTITNANFDRTRIIERIHEGVALREKFITEMKGHGINIPGNLHPSTSWKPAGEQDLVDTAAMVGVLTTENEDVRSLRELVTYGVKGMAAYAEHAGNLGYNSDGVDGFMQRALAATTNDSLSADELVALVLETGRHGVEVMALLDKANTTTYGNPEITEVNLGVRNNPAILISGHDMKDMEELLRQTEGTGVDVYTHSEMLPANYYPAFKKYNHFVGNYGNSWWKQTTEFETFNGPVLFTTNCIVPPRDSYKNRIYTTGASGYKGCTHIADREPGKEKDFSVIIEHARKCAPPTEIESGTLIGGFAHNQVLQLADKVVEAVKSGAIRKFVVMGGCDGRMKSRDYYTEFAQKLPKDTVILTAGCAKYRYNKLKLGDINGIPRVLDAGQCNDSYSLAVIALTLKDVFGKNDINELPIAYNIAWYEQKAIIVLLALLYLGVRNIYLGPTLPGFLSPNVVNVLVDKFDITGITTPDEDMRILLN
ncbi:MAG: hydroxylamine reductase [Bacteroidales bacterium]|nr:hydroxylamine reductase [Bacteroidales bacterium]